MFKSENKRLVARETSLGIGSRNANIADAIERLYRKRK